MVEKCGVCNEQDSKYKCPHCLVRYCSVKCFKVHLATHEEDDQQAATTTTTTTATNGSETTTTTNTIPIHTTTTSNPTSNPTDTPSTQSTNPLQTLQSDPRLLHLYTRHPNLPSQLSEIFSMTLPSYNGQSNGRDSPTAMDRGGSITPGGGGGTTPAGGYGSDHSSHFQRKKNQISSRGQWTQEKADKNALRRLVEIAGRDEGIREFVELCGIVMEEGSGGGIASLS